MTELKYTISIIIPTLDRNKITLATLKSFENQTFNNFELVVIDQTTLPSTQLSAFNTDAYNYKYYHINKKSLPNARNIAAKVAKGDIMLFVDDDTIPEPNLISCYIEEFQKQDESVWLIGGYIYEKSTNILSEKSDISGGYLTKYGKTLKNFSSESYAECEWVAGGNFAILKDKFIELGGFDINYIGNAMLEDCDFGFKVRAHGGRVLFSPRPSVEHLRAESGGTKFSNPDYSMYYRSHNTVYFFRKYNRRFYLPIVFFYLNGIAIKNLINGKHSINAFYYTWKGFIKGFFTRIPDFIDS
ncbi:MAG: glycosyltransferase family 2 protein [Candidatus Marinimicrobia bacterium]|nr:glycosyltransferase family 2 protein [Candidatus Neomarinimicrobiota bacterium]